MSENEDQQSAKPGSVILKRNSMYLLRWSLVWNDLKFFCKLSRPYGTSEGRSAYEWWLLDLELMSFPLHSSIFNLKCKRKTTGAPSGFNFIICVMTGFVAGGHHWVLSPALLSLLCGSRLHVLHQQEQGDHCSRSTVLAWWKDWASYLNEASVIAPLNPVLHLSFTV